MFKLVKVNPQNLKNMNLGIEVFENLSFKDDRGSLNVNFEGEISKSFNFISIKESSSKPLTGRGLHHQENPFGQHKIISLEKGSILDFSFDTEKNDKQIYCLLLDSSMNISIHFPERFAHGFITLTETKFKYTCIGKYIEEKEITYNVLPSISKLLKLGDISLSKKDSSSSPIDVSF